MAMAEHGQAVVVTPFTLMGAMTPVTLPAALAQQNAEALFGAVLTQLVNPGTPVMYGAFTTNVDMRSGAPAFGTPENAKANIASGQLARRYGLPYRTSNANASNAADAQAAYETEMSLWGAVLGGAHLVYHAAGWLEGGLTASFEKLVLDVEMLQHMMEFLRPIEMDEDALGFEAIRGVATGGHFFGEPHTLARYETAFYQPLVSNWQNYENWRLGGAKDATERATEIWQRALREYEEPAMDPAIREALDAYVARAPRRDRQRRAVESRARVMTSRRRPVRLLVHAKEPDEVLEVVARRHPDATVAVCRDYAGVSAKLELFAPEVVYSVRFAGTPDFPRAALVESPNVRWISVGGSGTDHLAPWDPDW